MSSEWYRNGIGMLSESFWLPKFQGFVCLNFIFYFVGWKVEIRQMCYMILLVFCCRWGYVPKSTFINSWKIINNETVLQCTQQFRWYIFRIVLRLFSVCSPFVLRSFSVRSPFILRWSSVRSPFILRSISVQSPFGNRGTNGERSKNHRRQNGDVSTTHRYWNEGTAKRKKETNDTET